MSRKNFKVATAENGVTPKQDKKHCFSNVEKDKTPTGKVKTFKDKKALRKEREEQFKNFRIRALKRRCKAMNMTDEEIEAKVKELIEVMETPNSYDVLLFFNPDNKQMVMEILKNNDLVTKIIGKNYAYLDADKETLATLREILPPGTKIHPYTKKKKSVLEPRPAKTRGKKAHTKAEKKAIAKKAKKIRKAIKLKAHFDRKEHAKQRKAENCKKMRKIAKAKKLFEKRVKKVEAKVLSLQKNNGSKAIKTALKKAA